MIIGSDLVDILSTELWSCDFFTSLIKSKCVADKKRGFLVWSIV